ncbi:metallophosphoesterase [Ilumatobacter nonamiensis]|uniref:metallophosphoesterase n=1 Tax=Ilumatobacter nonamiensis TaxID=467093 RepID=UPI00068637F5|nr:metallophosphoesterase [Ilumatobacter nonamiensis]
MYVLAHLSDIHVGGPSAGSGERFSLAIDTINAMTRPVDRVLITGDLTHSSSSAEWSEFHERLDALTIPWTAIAGNHDLPDGQFGGHRSMTDGPLRFVLVDSSTGQFDGDDAAWLDAELRAHPDDRTVVALHHPPFETGIWWMDCNGIDGADRFEQIVRAHPQVFQVLTGHLHRPIHTQWGACSLWVSPSTAVSIAFDLDPQHVPAESSEGPSFSLHAYTDSTVISHIVPVGASARRTPLEADSPDLLDQFREIQSRRDSAFDRR